MTRSHPSHTQVQLRGVHLCCGGCVQAAVTAAESVAGVKCRCNMDHGTVTVTAPDDAAAQQALDAIASAGLYGESDDPHLAISADPAIPAGKIQKAIVSGIHNCCQPCYDAIEGAINSVEGVTSDTNQPGLTTFTVNGEFSATQLVQAFHTAGFHATVRNSGEARECHLCGKPTAIQFGGEPVCEDCYQKAGSCCMEFGGDDLWRKREEEAGLPGMR